MPVCRVAAWPASVWLSQPPTHLVAPEDAEELRRIHALAEPSALQVVQLVFVTAPVLAPALELELVLELALVLVPVPVLALALAPVLVLELELELELVLVLVLVLAGFSQPRRCVLAFVLVLVLA